MVSPHRYAQQRKQALSEGIVRDAADVIYAHLLLEPWMLTRISGDIPSCIPAKYHKLLREILVMAYLNTVYKNMSRTLTLSEKHKTLTKALQYTEMVESAQAEDLAERRKAVQAFCRIGNVRESAGR